MDNETDETYFRSTMTRIYAGDLAMLKRRQRQMSMERNREVTAAEVLHEALALWRIEEAQAGDRAGGAW